jgi:hypothetical protein
MNRICTYCLIVQTSTDMPTMEPFCNGCPEEKPHQNNDDNTDNKIKQESSINITTKGIDKIT